MQANKNSISSGKTKLQGGGEGTVSVQGVKSLGGHFACLCRGFEYYEVKKIVIIFQNENGNTYKLLMTLILSKPLLSSTFLSILAPK